MATPPADAPPPPAPPPAKQPGVRATMWISGLAVVISLFSFLTSDSREVKVSNFGIDAAIKGQCLEWAGFVMGHPKLDERQIDGIALRASRSTSAMGQKQSILDLCGSATEYRTADAEAARSISIDSHEGGEVTTYAPSPAQVAEMERLVTEGATFGDALQEVLGFVEEKPTASEDSD